MKPPPFRYERPDSVVEALQILDENGDSAKVLAGGQSLVALMNLRLAAPEVVVDLGRLDGLRYVRRDQDQLRIGALTTHASIEQDASIARDCRLLAEAVRHIGHTAIRNRGTVGGSIAHADPAAELPVVLAALGGEVTVTSSGGSRRIPAGELFQGFLMTSIEANEIVTEVSFPVDRVGSGSAFEEFARRPGDFALVAAACRVERNGDGVAAGRVALGGVGSVPEFVELPSAADADQAVAHANAAVAAVSPASDIHGSAGYRRHLIRRLTERAIRRALAGGER